MTGFTTIFGNAPLAPAKVAYQALTLAASTTFSWPTELNTGTNIVADLNDVAASSAGLVWTMPSALLVGAGSEVVFNNVGANTFSVQDAGGNLILTVPAGQVWLIYLRDNSTVGGAWRVLQMGAGTSVAQAGPLAGAGLIASNGQLIENMPTQTLATNYTTGTADRAIAFLWTGGAGTFTIPAVSSLASPPGWFVGIKNAGTGSLVLQPTGATIDGSTTVTLNPNDFAYVISDGVNLQTLGRGQSANFAFSLLSVNVAGAGNYTLSSNQQNQIAYKFTGILTGNRTVIVPNTLQQYWVDNETSGPFTLTVQTAAGSGVTVTQGQRAILYCDGSNVLNAATAGISVPISVAQGGTGAITADAALAGLGGTSTGIGVFKAADQPTAQGVLDVPSNANATNLAIEMGLL